MRWGVGPGDRGGHSPSVLGSTFTYLLRVGRGCRDAAAQPTAGASCVSPMRRNRPPASGSGRVTTKHVEKAIRLWRHGRAPTGVMAATHGGDGNVGASKIRSVVGKNIYTALSGQSGAAKAYGRTRQRAFDVFRNHAQEMECGFRRCSRCSIRSPRCSPIRPCAADKHQACSGSRCRS